MTNLMLVGVGGWIICGVLAYGLTFAFFQGKFAVSKDKYYAWDIFFAFIIGLTGPIGLAITLVKGRLTYGLKWI